MHARYEGAGEATINRTTWAERQLMLLFALPAQLAHKIRQVFVHCTFLLTIAIEITISVTSDVNFVEQLHRSPL